VATEVGTFVSATGGTFETAMPGTFVSAAGGTFETVMPGTFHSATGGTFETVLGGTIKPLPSYEDAKHCHLRYIVHQADGLSAHRYKGCSIKKT
jgi:hypothetical protein